MALASVVALVRTCVEIFKLVVGRSPLVLVDRAVAAVRALTLVLCRARTTRFASAELAASMEEKDMQIRTVRS